MKVYPQTHPTKQIKFCAQSVNVSCGTMSTANRNSQYFYAGDNVKLVIGNKQLRLANNGGISHNLYPPSGFTKIEGDRLEIRTQGGNPNSADVQFKTTEDRDLAIAEIQPMIETANNAAMQRTLAAAKAYNAQKQKGSS